jgi:hypothetical protein
MTLKFNKILTFKKLHFAGWSIFFLYKFNVEFNYVNKISFILFEDVFIYTIIGCIFSYFLYKIYSKIKLLNKNLPYVIANIFLFSIIFSFLWILTYLIVISFAFNTQNKNYLNISLILDYSFFESFTLIMYSILYFIISLTIKYNEETSNEIKFNEKLENLKLVTLQNKLKPNLIKKSLELIKSNLDENPNLSENLINSLSDLLRAVLNNLKKNVFLIKNEIEILQSYFELYKAISEKPIFFYCDISHAGKEKVIKQKSLFNCVSSIVDLLEEINYAYNSLTFKLKENENTIIITIIINKSSFNTKEAVNYNFEELLFNNKINLSDFNSNVDETDKYIRISYNQELIKNE